MYPHADRATLELLTRMLAFGGRVDGARGLDPDKRITVKEALGSVFVAAVRRPECEVAAARAREA